ncbi:MAG: patatin family protein [Bacilli bacterium]
MAKDKVYSGLGNLPKGKASDDVTPGCLVLEGGAFRGVYTSGVLDCLMLNNLNFETTIGVSAGSLNGINYVSGQIGRAGYLNLRFRHDPQYIGPKAIVKDGGVIGFDYILNGKAAMTQPLDEKKLFFTNRKFYAVITNVKNGQTEYKELHQYALWRFYKILQASSSMPFFSSMVHIDKAYYLDGGCSCKIPYQWALDQGYKKIVVVRTREEEFRKPATTDMDKAIYKLRYGKYPQFLEALSKSNEDYNRQCQEVSELGKQKKVFVISPSVPVDISRLEGDMDKLGDLYWQGYNDCKARLEELKKYLAE